MSREKPTHSESFTDKLTLEAFRPLVPLVGGFLVFVTLEMATSIAIGLYRGVPLSEFVTHYSAIAEVWFPVAFFAWTIAVIVFDILSSATGGNTDR